MLLGAALISWRRSAFSHGRVLRVDGVGLHALNAQVGVVGRVEPAAPEPVQVHGRGVLHRAEEVGRLGVLVGPAGGVLLEGVIEQLAAHDGLAQHVQGRGGLAVGVVAELQHRLRVGHNRGLQALVGGHVGGDVAGLAAARGVVALPFLLGQVLAERVQALVHPRPLPLVGVHDHREEVVPYFVDNDRNHAVLPLRRVGAVGLGPAAVEAQHRVLHAAHRPVHRNGHRVLVGES